MKKYHRSPLDQERRATDTKTRPHAPSSVKRHRPSHALGILADRTYRVLGGQRTGIIHFSV